MKKISILIISFLFLLFSSCKHEVILPETKYDLETLDEYLQSLPENTPQTPYNIILKNLPNVITGESSSSPKPGTLQYILKKNSKKYVNLILPENVIEIGKDAFYYVYNLVNIKLPDSVTTLDKRCFYNCIYLYSIFIPKNVTYISPDAFYLNVYLTQLSVDPKNQIYDSRNNCNAIVETTTNTILRGCQKTEFPDSIKKIGYMAFSGNAPTITILPNSIEEIDDYAFYCATEVTRLEIPDSVTKIGSHAFEYLYSLTSFTLPKNVTDWGNYGLTFYNCLNLEQIIIPEGTKTIAPGMFHSCPKLKCDVLYIPESVTYIGDGAFGSLYSNNIVVASGNRFYDSRENCNAIIETSTNTLLKGCTNTIIPNTVKILAPYSFSSCLSNSITIPSSVEFIKEYTFSGSKIVSITIPSSVKEIEKYAFLNCKNLETVSINTGITELSESLFLNCENLTKVSIPNTVKTIGKFAFQGCTSLSSIILPSSINKIHEVSFYACTSLESITYKGKMAQWKQIMNNYSFLNINYNAIIKCTDGNILNRNL